MENVILYPTREGISDGLITQGKLFPKGLAERLVKNKMYDYEIKPENIVANKEIAILAMEAQDRVKEQKAELERLKAEFEEQKAQFEKQVGKKGKKETAEI